MTTSSISTCTDPTAIVHSHDRPWIALDDSGAMRIKVLVVDEALRQVVFLFRLEAGAVMRPHRHWCHAIAYTTAGEWQYEGGVLTQGSVAYEPFGSEHTPSSVHGAEVVAVLKSDSERFLDVFLEDGTVFPMDLAFFKKIAAR